MYSLTFVIGPETLCLCPETELPGLGRPAPEALDLNGVMDCETPLARVNCSRSSTFVRPFAAKCGITALTFETASTSKEVRVKNIKVKLRATTEVTNYSSIRKTPRNGSTTRALELQQK